MKSIYLFIVIIFGFSLSFMSLQNTSSELKPRKEKWAIVDQNIRQRKDPKTTLRLCKELLKELNKGNYPDEEVKAKLYIHHLNYELSDDTDFLDNNLLIELDQDINTLPFPQKNYMALIGYKLIEDYIQSNEWDIKQRINSNYNVLDIHTWKMEDFRTKSKFYKTTTLNNPDGLKQIPLTDISYLILEEKSDIGYIKNVYQALLYLDLRFQKQHLYNSNISALNVEDAFSGFSANPSLQTYIISSQIFRDQFPENTKARLEMEFWSHLLSLQNTPKIEEIYLNNLIAIGTNNNPELQAEKNYRIANLYYAKANKINWNGIQNIKSINNLKQEKTTQFTKTIQYLNLVITSIKDKTSKRALELKNKAFHLKQFITTSISFNINGKHTYTSNQDLAFDISSRNLNEINLEVYRIDPIEYNNKLNSVHWNERNKMLSHLQNKTKQWEGQYNIKYTSNYIEDKRQLIIPRLEYGLYAVTIKDDYNKSLIFQVSDLYVERDNKQITVKSAKDYSIVKNATLCVGSNLSKRHPFNKEGELTYTSKQKEFYSILYGSDTYYLFDQYLNYYLKRNDNNKHVKDEIFTDRSIYRPGQTVHVKVLQKYKKNNDILYSLSNANKVKIQLKDSQYELIEEKTISFNEFSSGNTSFVLPKDILNGRFTITTDHGNHYIQVEEYKRPTFYIDFEKDSTEKRLGDIIKLPLRAKTFSGLALNNAKVEYTITYSNSSYIFWRCGYPNWSESYILNHQNTILDKDGNLLLEINTNDIPDAMKANNLVQFSIEAKVIDINGDSETETTSFILSKEGLTFGQLSEYKLSEGSTIAPLVNITNFHGIEINTSIGYTLVKLQEPKHILQQSNSASENNWLLPTGYNSTTGLNHLAKLNAEILDTWPTDKNISSGHIKSNQKANIDLDIPAGIYKIIYTVNDVKGTLITKNQYLKIYPTKGKPKLKDEGIFSSAQQITYNVGDKFTTSLTLPFSSKYYYVLSDFNGIIQSGIAKGQDIIKLHQTIEERSKGGLVLNVKTVYNNKLYQFSQSYKVGWKLDLSTKWVNIRHKIQPQSEQEWKLEVKNATGTYDDVEILAFMYDTSLDEIKKHDITYRIENQPLYTFSKYLKAYTLQPNFRTSLHSNHTPYYSYELTQPNGIQFEPVLNILSLNKKFTSFRRHKSVNLRSQSNRAMADGISISAESEESAEYASAVSSANSDLTAFEDVDDESLNIISKNSNSKTNNKSTQIRENFKETIFFYPELTTNDKGIVSIPFTMSDGIGQYKLMLYGHTKDLKQFYLEEDIVANKELMTELHKPRFLYSGDKIIWTAKVSNLSDKIQEATVQLKLTDITTAQLIFESDNTPQPIVLEPGESKSIQWESSIPNNIIGEIKYELRAETDTYVDIEIDKIPVLTTQKLIHENFALTIPAHKSKTFNLSDLLNTSNFEQFRLECMSKPIWQVIKALPYASSKDDKIISNLLDEYITIKIGQNILQKNPNISERLLALSKTIQHSELRKRQELKSISLEEIPWLSDAKNQEEEMQQLSKFFTKNNLENRIKTLERKISKHQSSSGGFSWIKGGKDSYYMSLYVAKSLSNLEKLNLGKEDLKSLKANLLNYLDSEVLKQYRRLEINKSLDNINVSHVSYLETRTYFLNDYTIDKKSRLAFDFFLNRSLLHWSDANFTNRIALTKIAHGNGNLKISDDIFNTINEYRLDNTEQQTIYWKELANGISWQNRKLVNHADIIYLYTLKGRPESEIYQLQNWLLQQKRSQYWGSSSETSQLIYALLLNVDNTHIFDQIPVDIKIGGKLVNFSQIEGWLSKTWTKGELSNLNALKLEVTNHSDRPIWVSGYQQYFTSIAEVKTEKTSICSIEKVFYKRTFKNNEENWIKTTLKDLKIGDEIKVNMTLTLPQQLDFVYLQDYFGACFEPTNRISGFKYDGKGSYYLNIKDHKMQFFFDHISRGTHEFEFKTRIKQLGHFSNGYSEFQSYYAPEFGGHSDSKYIEVIKD